MSTPAVRIEGLWKEYDIGGPARDPRASVRDLLVQAPSMLFRRLWRGRGSPSDSRFWALQDVSLEVGAGEAVGILGPNGAGKSTLLKILSRITEPTRGRAEIRGRVASLLEVGTGFHPELTGRENIFLNGTILGMSRRDIRQRLDAIVEFSGVERFLETPVKHYSSGMHVRLAFAVAAHLEPDILVVDEVLAVGDAAFQRKCLGKMADAARGGRAILFVSHQLGMIGRLCQRAVLLDAGRVKARGPVSDVIEEYVTSLENAGGLAASQTATPSGEKEARLVLAQTESVAGRTSKSFPHHSAIDLVICFTLRNGAPDLLLSVTVRGRLSRHAVFTSQTSCLQGNANRSGSYEARMRIPGHTLTPGEYASDVSIIAAYGHIVDILYAASPFSVVDVGSPMAQYEGRDYGMVFVDCEWSVTRADAGG